MFFKVQSALNDAFSSHYKLNELYWLHTDDGWKEFTVDSANVFFKGYIDDTEVSEDVLREIIASDTPIKFGNFIAITAIGNTVKILHDYHRSFPLSVDYENKSISTSYSGFRVPSESMLVLDHDSGNNDNFRIKFINLNLLDEVNVDQMEYEEVVDGIDKILLNRFSDFFKHNTLPVKLFVSGGIDTVLCWAYLKKLRIDYELLTFEHSYESYFVKQNELFLKNFWGYSQFHSFELPSVLVTGALGDETMLRGPYDSNTWLEQFGTNLPSVLLPTHYQYYYCNRPKNLKLYQPSNINDKKIAAQLILGHVLNDHQHWHLDNTITFTPYKDIRITKLLLRLSYDNIFGQIVDAAISKELVNRNCPQLLRHLETHKNVLRKWQINYNAFLDDK
jgi:hypothetical protein